MTIVANCRDVFFLFFHLLPAVPFWFSPIISVCFIYRASKCLMARNRGGRGAGAYRKTGDVGNFAFSNTASTLQAKNYLTYLEGGSESRNLVPD